MEFRKLYIFEFEEKNENIIKKNYWYLVMKEGGGVSFYFFFFCEINFFFICI